MQPNARIPRWPATRENAHDRRTVLVACRSGQCCDSMIFGHGPCRLDLIEDAEGAAFSAMFSFDFTLEAPNRVGIVDRLMIVWPSAGSSNPR